MVYIRKGFFKRSAGPGCVVVSDNEVNSSGYEVLSVDGYDENNVLPPKKGQDTLKCVPKFRILFVGKIQFMASSTRT